MRIVFIGILLILIALSTPSFSFMGFRPSIPQYQHILIRGTSSGDAMSDVAVEPWQKIFVNRSTYVIWLNRSDSPVSIWFGEGTDCGKLPQYFPSTRNFRNKKCHVIAEPMPPGKQIRILFNDSGGYPYEIRFVGTESAIQGKIVVH